MAPESITKLIPVNRIMPSRYQTRKDFSEDSLKSLAESIKNEGLEQAVMVRLIPAPNPLPAGFTSPDEEWYELIFGERRLRSCKLAGLDVIEAKVVEVVSEASAAAKGMVENSQKEDINPIEEAENYELLSHLDPAYWTHDRIATAAGRSREYVTKSIGMLKLSESVKANVRRRTLSRSHALEIVRLPTNELQEKVAKSIISEDFNRSDTRNLIDKVLLQHPESAKDHSPLTSNAPSPFMREGGDEGGTFKITKSGKGIKITAQFPTIPALPTLKVALETSYNEFLAQASTPKQPKPKPRTPRGTGANIQEPSPLAGEDAQRAGEVSKPSEVSNKEPSPLAGEGLGEGPNRGDLSFPNASIGNPAVAPQVSSQSLKDPALSANDPINAMVGSIFTPGQLNAMKQQQLEMINRLKETLNTPEGRAQMEELAKSQGFKTPEDYIASIEQLMKDQGL